MEDGQVKSTSRTKQLQKEVDNLRQTNKVLLERLNKINQESFGNSISPRKRS